MKIENECLKYIFTETAVNTMKQMIWSCCEDIFYLVDWFFSIPCPHFTCQRELIRVFTIKLKIDLCHIPLLKYPLQIFLESPVCQTGEEGDKVFRPKSCLNKKHYSVTSDNNLIARF